MLILTEKEIENSILEYLSLLSGCLCYKNNNVGVYDKTKGLFRKPMSKFIPKGVADIYGTIHGRTIYIEVKKESEHKFLRKYYHEIKDYRGVDKKRNHLQNQIKFIESNKAVGCLAFFASSIDDVKRELGV